MRDDHAVRSARRCRSSVAAHAGRMGAHRAGRRQRSRRRLPYVLCLPAGPALAIPFAMLTAWPPLGRLAARVGIGRLPEETATPEELRQLSLPRSGAAGSAGRAASESMRCRQDRACHRSGHSASITATGHVRAAMDRALSRIHPARRSRVRRRRSCRRSRRVVPSARRAGGRGRTAARHGRGC